jgi:hypothetical protein
VCTVLYSLFLSLPECNSSSSSWGLPPQPLDESTPPNQSLFFYFYFLTATNFPNDSEIDSINIAPHRA